MNSKYETGLRRQACRRDSSGWFASQIFLSASGTYDRLLAGGLNPGFVRAIFASTEVVRADNQSIRSCKAPVLWAKCFNSDQSL
jgi:hypothetical protein